MKKLLDELRLTFHNKIGNDECFGFETRRSDSSCALSRLKSTSSWDSADLVSVTPSSMALIPSWVWGTLSLEVAVLEESWRISQFWGNWGDGLDGSTGLAFCNGPYRFRLRVLQRLSAARNDGELEKEEFWPLCISKWRVDGCVELISLILSASLFLCWSGGRPQMVVLPRSATGLAWGGLGINWVDC